MYITWEALFLFCTLVVAIIALVIDINKKDNRPATNTAVIFLIIW